MCKVKAEGAFEYFRQQNCLAWRDLLKANPVRFQLSLAFWSFCSKSASREHKVHFSYQDSRLKTWKRGSVLNPGRESEIVKIIEKIKGRERSKAEERERGKRTKWKSVSKVSSEALTESPRQQNSLAQSNFLKPDPAEIQISLAF